MADLKRILCAIACLVVVPAAAYAQASIAGVVRDTSGAVLPGVTVEAASPALIEKVRSVVTDGTGQYKIVDLRPGAYSVAFTLPGFNALKREGIELAGSFTATVNADLRVGAVEETVTVTGDAPIVDVQSVTQQRVLGKDILDSIPAGRNHANFALLIPGMTGAVDYGGTNNLNLSTLTVHGGRLGDQRVTVDGMSISATSGNGELSNFIPDQTSTQEVAVSFAAGSADQAFGGVQMNLIPREGGNVFKGSFFATAVNSSFQGSNYTQDLQDRGLRAPNSIKLVYDVNPGGGGPIVKDKLWFYSAARWQTTQTYVAGLWNNKNAGDPTKWTYEPDLGNPAVLPLIQQSGNTRVTWQLTPRNKVAGFYEHQYRVWEQLTPTIAPESATKYDFPKNEFMTGTYTSPITSRLLLDVRASNIIQGWKDRFPSGGSSLEFTQPLPDVFKSLIAVTEQGGIIPNLLYRGAGQTGLGPFIRVQGWIASAQASLSYVTGAHAFKVGFLDTWGTRHVDYENIDSSLRYRFNNGVPNLITQLATPYGFVNNLASELGVFAQDKWTLNRLTLNLGARFDYLNIRFPEQHLGPGVLVPSRNVTFPENNYLGWNDISPRLGAVYDLFGTGKTALKVNLGRYVIAQRLTSSYTDLGNPVNAMANLVTRSWSDRSGLGVNNDYIPQCDLLNAAANGECGALSDARFGQPIPSTVSDPEMLHGWSKRPFDWEFETGIQHQLMPRVGVDVSYFRRWYGNFTTTDNLLVAASDYSPYGVTAPADARLPGGGGYAVNDLYNLNPNKVGQVNNLFTLAGNYGTQIEHWNGVDVTLNVRLRQGTMVQGGMSTGRTSTDSCDIVAKIDNPSALYCHVDTAFLTQVKFLGTYSVPKVDVQISATFRSVPGPNILANYIATNAVVQPSLGRPLSAGAANVTVNLVQPGTLYGERSNLLDMRFSKIFKFSRYRTALSVDMSNMLNGNAVTTLNNNFATWQVPTAIDLARFAKISASFDF
ncbi:MAG: carboxypeptidase regulatory-like domain-containing protein [Acidobacteriota bacterium]